MIYQLMLINPGGSRFPPVKAWKARDSDLQRISAVQTCGKAGIEALTEMLLVANETDVRDGSNDDVPHTVVALSSTRVGDLDFTTAEWARRLVVLEEVRRGIMDVSLAYKQLKS